MEPWHGGSHLYRARVLLQVGHAVCATMTPGHDPVQKVRWPSCLSSCGAWDLPCQQPGFTPAALQQQPCRPMILASGRSCAQCRHPCSRSGQAPGSAAAAAAELPAHSSDPRCAQVTLIPRGQAKGLTWFLPGEDPTLLSKQQIFARVVGALGGRAAEEVIFGDPEITTGASGDLQQVRRAPLLCAAATPACLLQRRGWPPSQRDACTSQPAPAQLCSMRSPDMRTRWAQVWYQPVQLVMLRGPTAGPCGCR